MLLYFIQTTLLLLLTLGLYKLILEHIKIHTFKRYYLLCSLVFAFTLPLIKIPSTTVLTVANSKLTELNEVIISSENYKAVPSFSSLFTGGNILLVLYIFGVLFMLTRFVLAILHYSKMDKQGTIVLDRGQRFVLLKHLNMAFTFRKTIYLPPHIPIDWNHKIILHEYNHVKQNHSFDILFIEILKVVFWFQPLLYWYQQHIALNHEFLADDSLNASKEEAQAYLQLLLAQTYQHNEQLFSSSFNFNLTKKRFIMLTKTNKPLQNTLAVLSTITCLILMGATTVFAQDKPKQGKTSTTSVQPHSASDEVFIAVTEPANYPGGMKAFNMDFISNFKAPNIQGSSLRIILMFIVEKDGSLNEIKVVRDPGFGVAESALEALSKTKKWIPAKENGQVVRSQFTLPITIQLAPETKEDEV